MAISGHVPSYACRCLNVHVLPQPAIDAPPVRVPADNAFTAVYVGDEGLSVSHIEVTLRARSHPIKESQDETSLLTRYTSLTCLVCDTLVYRVLQFVSPDVEYTEGPVLPSDDWAERDMLKSSTGWIEVHKDCLTGDAIRQAETSALYSKTFAIVVPPGSASLTSDNISYPSPAAPQSPSTGPKTFLPHLPPLFPPPPFTPTHDVFLHLLSIATSKSDGIRESAEKYIAQIIEDKIQEIAAAEADLRREVEVLWRKYRVGIDKIEQETLASGRPTLLARRRQSGGKWNGISQGTASGVHGTSASVRINDFVPVPSPPVRTSSANHRSTSALSTSLVTTGFHDPRAHGEQRLQSTASSSRHGIDLETSGSPRTRSGSDSSSRPSSITRVQSPSTNSSLTIAMPINGESSIREAYRRNMDQSKDIATSYRYVMDMGTLSNGAVSEVPLDDSALSPFHKPPSIPSSTKLPKSTKPAKNGKSEIEKRKQSDVGPSSSSMAKPRPAGSSIIVDDTHPHTNGKGKRKVTFDVKPDITIIESEPNVESQPQAVPGADEEVIFEMESETESHGHVETMSVSPRSTTPTIEPSRAPDRRRRSQISQAGLPSSFSALRPASLPVPSLMRAPLPRAEVEDRPRSQIVRESIVEATALREREAAIQTSVSYQEPSEPAESPEDDDDLSDPRYADIMKMVAAHTPSHRGAWKKDSKAWQMFVYRRDHKDKQKDDSAIVEEDEAGSSAAHASGRLGNADESEEDSGFEDDLGDGTYYPPMSSSLPIPIPPISQHRKSFGALEYEPKTSLSDRPGLLVPALRKTSDAIRRASYAERDLGRSIDPGALDFVVDEDDVQDDEPEGVDEVSKSRKRAYQILKARSEVPAAGMWRSLV